MKNMVSSMFTKYMKDWLIIAAVLLCSIKANAQVLASGSCGDNLTWALTEEYDLIIEGTGEMCDYEHGDAPWSEYCESIQTITMGEDVTNIGNYAFQGCSNLATINIPESVTSIGFGAFNGCSSLKDINIPENVTSIGDLTFAWCSNLTTITVAEGNTVYHSRSGCNAIIETSSNILMTGCSATVIPEGVTSIGYGAFNGCSNLTEINIPEGVSNIGDGAFYGCSSLITIKFPKSMERIGERAFVGCISLTTVHVCDIASWCNMTFLESDSNPFYKYARHLYLNGELVTDLIIPEGVTSIVWGAFQNCYNLKSISIPESVTNIGGIAFFECIGLTAITSKATIPPTIENELTYNNVNKSIPIYVPASSVESYKSAEYWSEFTNIRPITNEYPLTVSSAGYATMYLDYDAEIPDDVKVYIATSVEGDRLMMTQVTGVLPAETGVIVRAKAGTYTFVESEDTPANVDGNLLSGTPTDTYITAESGYKYYVLAQKNDLVGMYRLKLTDGQFLNNANKAYLALESSDLSIFDEETNTEDEGGQLSNRLRFDFGGTTDIEKTTDNGGQTTVIHDLHGRRIIDTEGLKGVYIVNGSKVIF